MRILLLLLVVVTVNGCRFIHLKEPYLDAQSAEKLQIPAGLDTPNTTSTLSVPSAESSSASVSDAPPEMPIRKRQSESGILKIDNQDGYAVLTVATDKDVMFDVMADFELENWSVMDSDEDDCEVSLYYFDQAAKERSEAGFFKRMFSRGYFQSDYSGEYKLSCTQSGSLTSVKFSKADSDLPKSFLADTVMNNLYSVFE